MRVLITHPAAALTKKAVENHAKIPAEQAKAQKQQGGIGQGLVHAAGDIFYPVADELNQVAIVIVFRKNQRIRLAKMTQGVEDQGRIVGGDMVVTAGPLGGSRLPPVVDLYVRFTSLGA